MDRLNMSLGHCGNVQSSGPLNYHYIHCFYELEDTTLIDVVFLNDKLFGIRAFMPDGTKKALYPTTGT